MSKSDSITNAGNETPIATILAASVKKTAASKKATASKEASKTKKGSSQKPGMTPFHSETPPVNGEKRSLTLPGGAELVLVYVEPGTFQMGSPETEKGRREDEVQHEVTLTKGYWIGRTAVTQGQWKSVMGKNPSLFKGDNLPVENVSWEDCQEFFQKVNTANPEIRLRLPTEAEWEFAARGGKESDGTVYSGSDAPDDVAWYVDNSDWGFHPVGAKAPNGLGLYDMSGNVWEWCQDWYEEYPSGSVTDPTGPSSGVLRVLRGGGWRSFAGRCRVACRFRGSPAPRNFRLGFRAAGVSGR